MIVKQGKGIWDTPVYSDLPRNEYEDPIVFEPLPTYGGYYGSCCRCFQISPLPDEALRKAETVDRAQEAAIRPNPALSSA